MAVGFATRPASEPQLKWIAALLEERDVTQAVRDIAAKAHEMDTRAASALIDHLRTCPKAQQPDQVTEPGVYRDENDQVYVVKFNRAKTHLYAMLIVEAPADRLMENGEVQELDLEYAPGAVFRLKASLKLTLEEGQALTARYGRCVVCGRRLKAAQSVAKGIGPVCGGYFR